MQIRILQALVGTDVDETWDEDGAEDDESARISGILKVGAFAAPPDMLD